MKKRIMALVLALVMCVGLAVPAFAAPVPLEAETTDEVMPRYPVLQVGCKAYLGGLTYANMVFSISQRNDGYRFESVSNISFETSDSSGIHYQITDYNYRLTDEVFYLTVWRKEMYGNLPTGLNDTLNATIRVEDAVASARDSSPILASSVSCEILQTDVVWIPVEKFLYQSAASGV